MILEKLLLAEFRELQNTKPRQSRLEAVWTIRHLLKRIDFNSEVVVDDDEAKLTRLLTSLKGAPLDEAENDLLLEFVKK